MRLAVSNIAWTDDVHSEVLSVLSKHGAHGVEVAPTRLWPGWEHMSVKDADRIRLAFASKGLQIPAMQSLLFGMPHLNVFGDEPNRFELLSHLDRLFPIARALGVRVLVFGSPRNRDRTGLSDTQAFSQAIEFFRCAAQKAYKEGVSLCIEPNPPQYGANFITGWKDALRLVESVDAKGFGLHLDTGCISMNGDSPAEAVRACGKAICHFHISEAQLADFSDPQVDHLSAARALLDIGYSGWVSIEMRMGAEPLNALDQALSFVKKTYF